MFERLQGNLHLRKRVKERMFCLWQMLFRIPKCLSAFKNSFSLWHMEGLLSISILLALVKKRHPEWLKSSAWKWLIIFCTCRNDVSDVSQLPQTQVLPSVQIRAAAVTHTHQERNSQIHCQPAHGLHFNGSGQQEYCGEGRQYQKHSRWKISAYRSFLLSDLT